MIKKSFELKNLNCAHCANIIDKELKKINSLQNHSLNFVTKELKIEIEEDNSKETIEKIKKLVVTLEDSVEIIEKDTREIKFRLENLFCQSCSIKIEKAILNLAEINDGFYNFSNQILTLIVSRDISSMDLKEKIQKLVDEIEEGVNVKDIQEETPLLPEKKSIHKEFYFLVFGALLFFLLISFEGLKNNIFLFIVPYLMISYDILLKALKNLRNKNPFDENFLMTIATLGAFGIGEYPEAIAVMLFYKIGEYFQEKAVTKSRNSIEALLNIKPQWANQYFDNSVRKIRPHEVAVGSNILVYPGESIPLDGIILKGNSSLDTKALTGESIPQEVAEGTAVLSGSVNITSTLEIKVTKDYNNSTITKILDLVENASIKKAKTEKFITTFAKYYTPIVVLLAFSVGVLLPLFIGDFSLWFYRALVFLVISCPCALVVSIPLGYFGGIGRASKHGILIKGGNYLEALNSVNKIILDKTGTLTKGQFVVTKVNIISGNEDELIETAIIGEADSNHPIAIAIKNYKKMSVDRKNLQSFEVIQGKGTKSVYENHIILVGNSKLMDENSIEFMNVDNCSTIVHIAKNNEYLGNIILEDEIKEDAQTFVNKAKSLGIQLIMLSGDNENSCANTAKSLGIEKYHSSLLPQDKVSILEKELSHRGKTIFVGDGINDAPVLKRADIGISMGGVGSDAAIEASDIVIMDDKLNKIITAIEISKKTKAIVLQNIIFALTIKIVILALGLGGHATMWEAIFADVGVALLAILNSIRALRD